MKETRSFKEGSKALATLACIGVAMLLAAGCESDQSSDPNNLMLLTRVLETNAEIADAAYSDSIATVQALEAAIEQFLTDTSEESFLAAREAWLVAQEPYGVTEVYRFRGSPIDDDNYNEDGGEDREILINAWPLGEALIDAE